jgi:hypothetical protein
VTIEEEFRRQVKATQILVELVARGVDHEVAECMDDRGWDAVCLLAGTRPASWRTREVVIGLLRRHDDARARMAAISDPLPGVLA